MTAPPSTGPTTAHAYELGRPGNDDSMDASTSTQPTSAPREWLGLAGFGVAVFAAAALGGLAAGSASSTYEALEQPPFAPPSWVFGPVWTVLYVTVALSGWLVWRRYGWDRSLTVYAIQLALNAAWTPLFFAGDRYGLALVEIVLLLGSIVAILVLFRRRVPVAALILVPYAAWVAFATVLNASIWWLN